MRSLMPGSLLPKVLVALLAIAVLYQLHASLSPQWTPLSKDTAAANPIPTTLRDTTEDRWFTDAKKPQHTEAADTDPSRAHQTLVHEHTPLKKPVPSHHATPVASPATVDLTSLDYNKTFISYGPKQCFPPFNTTLQHAAIARYVSCTEHAPFHPRETHRVAFATISTGAVEDAYERAIVSHMFHSAVHGSQTHMLCTDLSPGAWNKIAFLLSLVMNEFLKPVEERLEWFMWIDRDAIVMDACRPLSNFLPPATPQYDDINLIRSHDAFGLNAGVFLFRVNEWTLKFLNTVLAYPYYKPDDQLTFAEQTAMERIMDAGEEWSKHVARVPWYWFNAYPPEGGSTESFVDGTTPESLEWFRTRKGDFIAHFAGHPERLEEMPRWHNMLAQMGNVWEAKGGVQRDVTTEIKEYWAAWAKDELSEHQISGEPLKKGDGS